MSAFNPSALTERIAEASRQSPLLLGTGRDFAKTRWQRLRCSPSWIKREDELSFTMSGPKYRKLCGMNRILATSDEFVSFGSSRSAFLLALAQLCISQGQRLELYLLRSTPWQNTGPDAMYRTVFGEHEVHWVDREDWPHVRALIPPHKVIIPEGGVGESAFWGAMSLGLDIVEQMHELSIDLEHVWIDAGTGLTAQALIKSLGGLLESPPHVHVVLCAGSEEAFREGLARVPGSEAPFTLYRPSTARSYGSTNRKIWQTIARYLKTEGLLLDPLYSAKLLLGFEEHGQKESLVIHSGGGLNNFGYEEFLSDAILEKRD